MNFSEFSATFTFLIFVKFGSLDLVTEGGPEGGKLGWGDTGVVILATGS